MIQMFSTSVLSSLLTLAAVSGFSIPRFTVLPKEDTLVKLGDSLNLPCASTGNPNPTVINWLHNSKPVNFNKNFLRHNGDLRIPRVSKTDSGYYQCVASNVLGGVVSEPRNVVVAYFERISSPPRERKTLKVNSFFHAKQPLFDCHPKPTYIWHKNGVKVEESARIRVSLSGDLLISNIVETDGGAYTLTLENVFLQNKGAELALQLAKTIQLTVFDTVKSNSAKIIYVSKEQAIGEGKPVTLECYISGMTLDRVRVVWTKVNDNGDVKSIPQSSVYVLSKDRQRLFLSSPTTDDHGKFRCSVMVGMTSHDSRDIMLTVYSIPTFFIRPPANIQVYTDNSTSLNCTSGAFPLRNEMWYRNGVPIIANDEFHTVLANNTLVIEKLKWDDNGIFQCVSSNLAAMKVAFVNVKVANISAKILNDFTDVYGGHRANIVVPCVISGAPMPEISWLVNGTKIFFPSNQFSLLSNHSLLIHELGWGNTGRYTCVADNRIGIDRKTATVFVIIPTEIIEKPLRVTFARKGENIYLPCKVKHDPNINFTREWRRSNLPVKNSRYVVQEDGSLFIKHIRETDTGIDFSCHVFSHGGNVTLFTSLSIVQLPMAPSSPRLLGIQAYALHLIWDAPVDGGSPLIGYQLYMRNYSMHIFSTVISLNASQNSYQVTNLQAGGKYMFKVAAENRFGRSLMSDNTKWIETQTLRPSAAPSGFGSTESGTDYVILSWNLPSIRSNNGVLLGFYIAYRLAGYGMDYTNIFVDGATVTSYKMSGLPLFTRYELKIASHNKAGTGPWSRVKTADTKQGKPSLPPTNVTVSILNASNVEVGFRSPPQHQWNGRLTTISARYWPPGRPQDQQEYRTSYDSSSLHSQIFILPGLKPNTEYTLAVAVETTGGPSDGSSPVQFKTSEGIPDAVRDLQVSGIYSDAFSVSWKLPKETAGELKGYRVKYRLYGVGDNAWRTFDESPKAFGAVITPLEPRTRYEVSVAAFTSQGTSTYSSASVSTIESPQLPTAPTNLKAYGIWGHNISLGWTPGDSGRAVILNYLIEYNNETSYHLKTKEPTWRVIRNLTKILENPAHIWSLKPSTTYRFRMTAFNRMGASPMSEVSQDITTSEGVPSEAPLRVRATAPAVQTLLIEWDPPKATTWNSGSIKYQFIVKPKGQDPKIQVVPLELQDTQATSFTASTLKKYTMYNITVRLFNDKGYGPWSKAIFVSTSEDYPSGAPSNVAAEALSSSSVRVTWGDVPVSQRKGTILGYKVFYMMYGRTDTELHLDVPGGTMYNGVLTGLIGYTDYAIQVMAYTRVGGKFKGTPVIVRTLQGVPEKPHNVKFPQITNDFMQITWETPLRPNSIIITYQVRYKQNVSESVWSTHKRTAIETPRTARVYGLVYNMFYLFEIKARTSAGWGEPALEYVLITMDRVVPESPVILPIPLSSIRSQSMDVRWRARFDGNSLIRSYNLQYNKNFYGWVPFRYGIPPTDVIPASLNVLEVDKLDSSSYYQFRVRAVNDVGASPWSGSSKRMSTTAADPIGAPTMIRVLSKTPTSILFQWQPPVRQMTGELRGYRVKYKEVGGLDDFKSIGVDAKSRQFRLSNLKVFRLYDVSIGAFNDQGDGTWSPTYEWRTGEIAPTRAPDNVQVLVQGKNVIRVTWNPINRDTVNGYLYGYKVESVRLEPSSEGRRYRRALEAICPLVPTIQTHLAGPLSYEVSLNGLLKYTNYMITVRVYNAFGDGPKSPQKYFTTPEDVPGPPYLLSERVYTDLIDVDFDTPCYPNGKITGFRVDYREKNGDTPSPLEYGPDTRRIRVSNLRSSVTYLLSVSARTSVGYGQKTTIEFVTKGVPTPPTAPGRPALYKNVPSKLMIQWEQVGNGNLPVDVFLLQYREETGDWKDFRSLRPDVLAYDGSAVVYTIAGLSAEKTYWFRVRSTTTLGVSPFSKSSKPITTVKLIVTPKPFYKQIWFIFVLLILLLLIVVVIVFCCCRRAKKKFKLKKPMVTAKPMSSFEMSLVRGDEGRESQQRLLPSTQNSSMASRKSKPVTDSTLVNSIAKSVNDKSSDTNDTSFQPLVPDSIANHYSNDPYHKNWRDSMDKKTKKELLSEFKKRHSSQASVDTLGERRRVGSEEKLDPPRMRPVPPNLDERKKMARSVPYLTDDHDPLFRPTNERPPSQQQQRRPGKKPFRPDLARSQPELHRVEKPVSRQPSFLRATQRDDNESFQEVYERERTKHELAMELDSQVDRAPPPYDFNSAPPAYTPSQLDNESERSYIPYYAQQQPRYASSSSREGYVPYNRFSSSDRGEPGYDQQRSLSPVPSTLSTQDGFAPPQNSKFDDEYLNDVIDGVDPDMTLV